MIPARMKGAFVWLAALAVAGTAVAVSGCNNDAYCFRNCNGETASGSGSGSGGAGGGGGILVGSGGQGGCMFGCSTSSSTGTGGTCEPTNGGIEKCDAIDNDCNGTVDDLPDLDLTHPKTCGTCANNCYALVTNWDALSIKCTPSATPGEPGKCEGTCDDDYFDLDGDPDGVCEYYCVANALDDTVCNNKDDDCDGQKDEDVKLCESTEACGKCGNKCVVLNGTAKCEDADNDAAKCDTATAACAIAKCDCTVPTDCWWDLDKKYITGCEYKCELTNGGVEICDGLDNDCDGKIDAADDLAGDVTVGKDCWGDPDGVCAAPEHAGKTACQGAQIICEGANVIGENAVLETCNGKDDDCDGAVDDNPTDVGVFCGQSNIAPCAFGKQQCVNGALTCVGAVDPKPETCNGQDDDCDGTIDKTGNMNPSDATGPCDVPPMPPASATQPCKAGTKACVGGVVTCQGAVGPTSTSDGCNDDANCDGLLTNQPDKSSDVANCGTCGNNCYDGSQHSIWACQNSTCVFQGCENGYYDTDSNQSCDYACIFISAQENCNGVDDDCDGLVDEGVTAPSPSQVCGVSPSATSPECTSAVSVTCQNGAWACTFPTGVCSPNCASAVEVCDTLDNDCDGALNETTANYGKPCASDDATPVPGDGACRTTGTIGCAGCTAVKANCMNVGNGCTEECDGIDNDCDGLVDETFKSKGSNAANFVKPAVTKIGASAWIYRYEASRPSATTDSPGTGNGYHCSGASCSGVPSAPAGEPLEKTLACSVNNKIPWFNVNPIEVEQVCQAMGGTICGTSTQWKVACEAQQTCTWGYSPAGAACKSTYTANTKYCNLGPSYDFAPLTPGDQDGLLETGSILLKNCSADWGGAGKIFDMTGNLREITKSAANTYPLMGGAFSTADTNGATCQFDFYAVDQNFKLYDVGFRCCFTQDPTQ